MRNRSKNIGRVWLHIGKLRGFQLGVQFDRFGWSVNLIFFYFGMEYGKKSKGQPQWR